MTGRGLWAHRDARRYLAGQSLSLLGDSAMWLACGIWVRTLTGSNAAAALTFLFFVAPALLAPLAGLLVDRVRRRPLLIVANLAGVAILAPLLLVRDRRDLWLIYAVMLLYGLLNLLIPPAQSALLAGVLPADLLPDANAALRTIQEGLRVLAPLAGAGLFAVVGGRAVALLDMATFLAAAALVATLGVREAPATGTATGIVAQIAAGFRFVAASAALRRLVLACAVTAFALGLGDATTYAIVTEGLHRTAQFTGVTQMVQGIGAVAGGVSAAPAIRRYGEVRTAVAGLVVFAAAPVLVAFSSLPVVLAGKASLGFALPWILVAVITVLQRVSPAELQGRVYAAVEVCTTGPQATGLGLGAALITVLDYRVVLGGEAVMLLLSAALLCRVRVESPLPAGNDGAGSPTPAVQFDS